MLISKPLLITTTIKKSRLLTLIYILTSDAFYKMSYFLLKFKKLRGFPEFSKIGLTLAPNGKFAFFSTLDALISKKMLEDSSGNALTSAQ